MTTLASLALEIETAGQSSLNVGDIGRGMQGVVSPLMASQCGVFSGKY